MTIGGLREGLRVTLVENLMLMKRQLLLCALCVTFSASAFAQTTTMTSKNGHEILPQAGDWAISMDGIPVVNFALNAINFNNNTGQTAQHPGYVSGFNQVLVGKYYNTAEQAYRVRLAINSTNTKTTTFFDDPFDTSSDPAELEDATSTRSTNVVIGVGMENRRGHNRLQGFYGAEALLALSGGGSKNTYGHVWNSAAFNDGEIANGDSRMLSSSNGLGFGLGARGFAGIEYFCAPKISLGAEFGWALGIYTQGRGGVESENVVNGAVETEEVDGSSSMRTFGFGVDNGSGQSVLGSGTAAFTINFHI